MNSDSENSSNESSTDISDREWDLFDLLVMEVAEDYDKRFLNREPYHNDPFTGKQYVEHVLGGHPQRCSDMFRMKKEVLFDLSDALKERALLKDTRYVTVEEQLCIFLYTIGHTVGNRVVADRFQHSQETISRHFRNVLKAICRFSKEVILPPDMNTPHPYIMSKGDKYYPWFQVHYIV